MGHLATKGRERTVHLEAISVGKNPDRPDANEDRVVVYGDDVFGVFDGVTDKSGRRYDGCTGGRLVGSILDRAVREAVDDRLAPTGAGAELIARLSEAIANAHLRYGIEDEAARDPNVRFSASAALVFPLGDALRVLQVGDCRVRIAGRIVHRENNLVEAVMAQIRCVAFDALAEHGRPLAERLAAARTYVVHGLRDAETHLPIELRGAVHQSTADRVATVVPQKAPEVPAELLRTLVLGGLRDAATFRNAPGPYGHGVLDGTSIPPDHVVDVTVPWPDDDVVEIYSDGYFGEPNRVGDIAAWEQHIDDVDRDDPYRIDAVPGTKGRDGDRRADDRTILILRRRPTHHVRT